MPIVTLDEAKAHLNITTSSNDTELQGMVDAATEWVESKIGPVVEVTVTGELHAAAPSGTLVLNKAPVISVSSITDTYGYGYTYDVADVVIDSEAGIIRPVASAQTFASPVTVTYTAGRATVPASVRLATLFYIKALWESQRGATKIPIQGFTEEGVSPSGGLLVYKAEQLLEPYLLPSVVA